MKKLLSIFAVVVGFVTMTSMQTVSTAEFKFESETHDFGKIPVGKPVSYEFKFTNAGTDPLIITAVEPTCGCTIADYTKTPVKKGETGSITLTYSAAGVGVFAKAVTVKSKSKTPVKVLYLKGEVIDVKPST